MPRPRPAVTQVQIPAFEPFAACHPSNFSLSSYLSAAVPLHIKQTINKKYTYFYPQKFG